MNFQLSFPNSRGKYLIFSLPQTNHYQIIKNLTIRPPIYKIIDEKKWGNKVAIFTLNDVKNISVKFDAQLKSFSSPSCTGSKLLYLAPNRFINGKDKQIQETAKKIIKNNKDFHKIIYSLYQFTLNYLTYGKPIESLYTYKQAMEERITDCGGFSTFLASLLQSLNIPSRLVVGFLIKENLFAKLSSNFEFCILNSEFLTMHAWLEVLPPNSSWFPVDPSIEWRRAHGLTKRQGGFGYVPADRLIVSYGCDFKIKINNKIYQVDLLQNPVYL